MHNPIRTLTLLAAVALGAAFISCEKVEDPFVDRVVSPVLVKIEGAALGDYVTDPVLKYAAADPLDMAALVYELDKSGILDKNVGIDSLPVASLPLTLSTRTGTKIAELTTNTAGRAAVSRTWEQLGLATPLKDKTVALQWSGTHKGQPFARYFRVQVK